MQPQSRSLKTMTSRFKLWVKVGGEERWADASKVFVHLLKEHDKKEDKFKELFKKREEKFIKQVHEYDKEYDDDLLEEFIEYWTEPNRRNTKMKFELRETWSLGMRLQRWKDNGFGKKKKNKVNYKLDTTGFPMAYCEKCGVSASYKQEELSGDSRCCNAKLLPEKGTTDDKHQ